MIQIPQRCRDTYFLTGLGLTALSASIFSFGLYKGVGEEQFFGLFAINFLIAIIYLIMIAAGGKLKHGHDGQYCLFLFLVQFLISAYALNRTLPVFENSADWFSVLLVIVGISYTVLAFMDALPRWSRHLITGITGIGFVLFVYLTIYLVPLYPISAFAFFALGISLHAFVPLLFVLFTLRWIIRRAAVSRSYAWSFSSGVAFSLLAAVIFSVQWSRMNHYVNRQYQHTLIDESTDIPSWTRVAQHLPDSWIAEKFLKSGLVYSLPSRSGDFFDFRMPSRNFDEVRRHDPLVMTAALFCEPSAMGEGERIRILQSGFNARHQAEDRLWSGSDLGTSDVITNARIWPRYRMAYTEKTVTVANHQAEERWPREQEAIYTFHLPEGGVVTSLSLWINGREEKGVLTTKGKADSAYRQIVGVERHDPSVVHWQEGNRVSVRVFPVPGNSSRIFKIGITAPLALHAGKLKYENINFEGPDAADAKEIVQVDWEGTPPGLSMDGFESHGPHRFIKDRLYRQDWDLEFADPGLAPGAFSFNGRTYRVQAYGPQRAAISFRQAYLDINEAWSRKDFDEALGAVKGLPVYAWDDGLVKLDDGNREDIYSRLHRNRFSMFPLYEIKDPATSLLVSKGGKLSPNISDIKESDFAGKLERWVQGGQRLCLFSLNGDLSQYLKSLKEHRIFNYESGSPARLGDLVARGQFAVNGEDDNHVVIDNAGIVLSRSAETAPSAAPDHLMRLFAYNHLMQQLHRGIISSQESDTALVGEAQQAYVVTPLSSLVVLETARDYDRFNIRDSDHSLKNASLKSNGAVPEPHEWALIIIAFGLMVWLRFRNYFRQLLARA